MGGTDKETLLRSIEANRSADRSALLQSVGTDTVTIPEDVLMWVNGHFREGERAAALELLSEAVDEGNQPVRPRLLRCAVIGSRGDIDRLREMVAQLRIDWRDVIVSGEYDILDGQLVHVRDLNQPIQDD